MAKNPGVEGRESDVLIHVLVTVKYMGELRNHSPISTSVKGLAASVGGESPKGADCAGGDGK